MTAAKYKKLTLHGGTSTITLYGGTSIHSAWKEVSSKFDLFDGVTDLFTVIEAAIEQGKRLGRAEVMTGLKNLEQSVSKQIIAIEKATPYKAPGRPKKRSASK